jgi:D-alanine-D-alanine ligase
VFVAPTPDDGGQLRSIANAKVLAQPEVYSPLVHGTFGEDGTLQGLLELAAVPYVGSGVLGSAAGMDKGIMKALFAQAGLPQCPFAVLCGPAANHDELLDPLGLPLFVKPANLGSSVGISKVKTRDALEPALARAFSFDRKVIVECGVDAREIEIAVIDGEPPAASVPGEVVPDREFYDYESKYASESRSELHIPAPLSRDMSERAGDLARQAFRAVDAEGYARVDLFLDRQTDQLLVNEINTIPGFTSISMFPKLWDASGLSYTALLERLVALARKRREARAALARSITP